MSKQTTGATHADSAKSWNRPQVRRIHAGQAEAGTSGTGGDNVVYS